MDFKEKFLNKTATIDDFDILFHDFIKNHSTKNFNWVQEVDREFFLKLKEEYKRKKYE